MAFWMQAESEYREAGEVHRWLREEWKRRT